MILFNHRVRYRKLSMGVYHNFIRAGRLWRSRSRQIRNDDWRSAGSEQTASTDLAVGALALVQAAIGDWRTDRG
jgi:hypothetical protein